MGLGLVVHMVVCYCGGYEFVSFCLFYSFVFVFVTNKAMCRLICTEAVEVNRSGSRCSFVGDLNPMVFTVTR